MRTRTDALMDAERLYGFLSEGPTGPAKADLLLAAGSHDLRVAEHAARLYHQGIAPLIVCSGGFGKMTEGVFQQPEGVLFARKCHSLGVPEEAVLIEDQARNTGENFTLSRKLLFAKGIHPQTGIIVCKPYMAKRAWAAASRQWPEVSWGVRTPDIPFSAYAADDTALDQEIQLMAGDLQRLRVYARLGYQVPVEVPDAVWQACQRLFQDGYSQYMIPE